MSGLTTDQKRRAIRALKRVMQEESCVGYFNDPVDCDSLGIPEYRDIVKKPMDLTKVQSKLEGGVYLSLSQVIDDVLLVWTNCYSFNEPGSYVCVACDEMAALFSQSWKQCGLEKWVKAPERDAHKKLPSTIQHSFDTFSKGKKQSSGAPRHDSSQGATSKGPARPDREAPIKSSDGLPPPHSKRPRLADKGTANSSLRLGHPLERCLKVVEAVLRHPQAAAFHSVLRSEPSLQSIKAKLLPGLKQGWGMVQYKTVADVLQDACCVFDGCRRNARSDDTLLQHCEVLEDLFRTRWAQAGLSSNAAAIHHRHGSPTTAHSPSSRRDDSLTHRDGTAHRHRVPIPPLGLPHLEQHDELSSLADFGSHDPALDALTGIASQPFPGQHGLGNAPPHSHHLPRHPFDGGSVPRSPRLGRAKPLPFDPTPILKAAEMQPWERALLEDYARLKQRRLAARLAADQAQREASRLSMMQGELQAAREAAEKLVPQTRPDPEPWPPNARYTNSVQPKGPREIQRVPKELWELERRLFADQPFSRQREGSKEAVPQPQGLDTVALTDPQSKLSAWERRMLSGPSLTQLRQAYQRLAAHT